MAGLGLEGYTELRVLGEGASGRVVMARHESSGQLVAIKQLAPRLAGDPGFRTRFRAEAEILGRLRHPNIAALQWFVEDERSAAIGMELVDGVALTRLIEQGPTTPEAALVVLRGSLRGLQHAHEAGIVHRDYKPDNVIVGGGGGSRLVDFGVAVPVGDRGPMAGTPRYMAPELWEQRPASAATDVYAAAAVLFSCLTGRHAFAGTTLTTLRDEHMREPAPVDAALQAPLRGLIATGLAKDPAARYPTAGSFLADLERVAEDTYGAAWAERGLAALGAGALVFAALFPISAAGGAVGGASAGTALTSMTLTTTQKQAVKLAARSVARPHPWLVPAAVGGAVVVAAATATGIVLASKHSSSPAPAPVAVSTPLASAAATASASATAPAASTAAPVRGPSTLPRVPPQLPRSGGAPGAEFAAAGGDSGPYGITTGLDGNLWFTAHDSVNRMTPSGTVASFRIPGGAAASNSGPGGIVRGADGNIWFSQGLQIGRVTPAGVITEFNMPAGDKSGNNREIAAGPDGALWFTQASGGSAAIGRITTSGVITEFPLPTVSGGPEGITAGPDGNLWFADNGRSSIGRITTSGVITEFRLPGSGSGLAGPDIVAGPDGNLWFTAPGPNAIMRITPSGAFTTYAIATPTSHPAGICVGPDGDLWYTEQSSNKIGRIPPA